MNKKQFIENYTLERVKTLPKDFAYTPHNIAREASQVYSQIQDIINDEQWEKAKRVLNLTDEDLELVRKSRDDYYKVEVSYANPRTNLPTQGE